MGSFVAYLTSTPTPINLTDLLDAIGSVITSCIGWMTSFLSVFTTGNGLILLAAILSFTLFGIHVLKSLMGR